MTRLFDACRCIEDVVQVRLDPTGTGRIRSRFSSAMAIRWRRVQVMIRTGLLEQDILGLRATLIANAAQAATGSSSKVLTFQRWMDAVLAGAILQDDATFVRPYVQEGYDAGLSFAQSETEQPSTPSPSDRVGTIAALAAVELQGICEAVSQQAVRVVANGLLTAQSSAKITRQIQSIVNSVGVNRTKTMIELLIVKAFSEATLDAYESQGIDEVGLVPESLPGRKRVGDFGTTGPGSRTSRTKVPSLRTIQRIRVVQRKLEKMKLVNVRTAEDDKVCSICESISEEGPYTINAARTLIPAHPHCRCVFVPVRKKRTTTGARR